MDVEELDGLDLEEEARVDDVGVLAILTGSIIKSVNSKRPTSKDDLNCSGGVYARTFW